MTVEVRSLERQLTMVVRSVIAPHELGEAFGRDLPKVFAYLTGVDADIAGPPFGRYFAFTHEEVDLEIGVPVKVHLAPSGDVTPSDIPAGEYAFKLHVGAYDGLGEVHDEVYAWIDANGREHAGPQWESYLDSTADMDDPSKLRTEVYAPIS